MKAVRIHDFGGPDVVRFEELPTPTPKEDEILVRVCAASVNPVDHKTWEGKYPAVRRDALPFTLGRDISGMVERCGSAAPGFRQGDAIYAMLEPQQGGFAEYVALKENEAAAKPMNLSHAEAAAVPLAALTAWQGLFDNGNLQAGQRVLIHGGAGGVGHFAIQFAKVAGANVLTTVANKDCAFARELGADEAIDYKAQRFEELMQDIDLVFDLVGGETQQRSWSILRTGGTLVSTLGQPPRDMASKFGIRALGYQAQPNAEQLTAIADLIDARRVRPVIAATYPFMQIAEAEKSQETGHPRGKIVLQLAA